MCGHLDQRLPYDLAVLAEVIDEIARLPNWDPIVRTMRPLIVMTEEHGLTIGRWGWKSPGRVDFHARRESLKTTWQSAYANRRCAIPCVGWWESTWHFSGADVLWLAGIWRHESEENSPRPGGIRPAVQMVTCDADTRWRFQSDRHPIPLPFDQASAWCKNPDTAETLDKPVSTLSLDGQTIAGVPQKTLFDSQ
jgi:putative SOS response-associated peptidase YedK